MVSDEESDNLCSSALMSPFNYSPIKQRSNLEWMQQSSKKPFYKTENKTANFKIKELYNI